MPERRMGGGPSPQDFSFETKDAQPNKRTREENEAIIRKRLPEIAGAIKEKIADLSQEAISELLEISLFAGAGLATNLMLDIPLVPGAIIDTVVYGIYQFNKRT